MLDISLGSPGMNLLLAYVVFFCLQCGSTMREAKKGNGELSHIEYTLVSTTHAACERFDMDVSMLMHMSSSAASSRRHP